MPDAENAVRSTADREAVARALHDADQPTLGYERRSPDEPTDPDGTWRSYLPMADRFLDSGIRLAPQIEVAMLNPGESASCSNCGCPDGSDRTLSGGFWCGCECHPENVEIDTDLIRNAADAQCRLDEIIGLINAADDGDEPPTNRDIYLIATGRA